MGTGNYSRRHAALRLRRAIRRHHPSGSVRWCCFRSCWTVLRHVMRGRPGCLLQSAGGGGGANRVLLASALSSMRTICPNMVIEPHRIIWSWNTGRWWVVCYIWYSEEGTGRGSSSPRPLLDVPNVKAHPSTASVPITVWLHNGPLLCGFNVPIKGLNSSSE